MTGPDAKRKYYNWNKEDLERALVAYENKDLFYSKT